jgi:hypothetical protein
MKFRKQMWSLAVVACTTFLCRGAGGQTAVGAQIHAGWAQIGAGYRQLRANNAAMSELQPTWMAPITEADARLGQALRFSVSQSTWPGARPIVYGNNHGISVIAGRRLQFELVPPSFFRNHSAKLADGFGNAGIEAKTRIASGNAEHGNYILTAILFHGFAPRSYENGALTGLYKPALTGGHMFGPVALLSSLGGYLPTGKIALQGRGIEWKGTAELHAGAHAWFDVEDNALFVRGGPDDGKAQNLISPGAFYVLRRADRASTHPEMIFDCGMQLATSEFHYYNRNLITEVRVAF